MEESLKQIAINTAPKKSYSIILSSNTTDFTTTISPPIQLRSDNWAIGLINLTTYNSIFNITAINNIFRYNNSTVWKVITLNPGAYEITDINNEIQRQLTLNGDSGISIIINQPTLGSIVNITGAGYQVDFTVVNSIGSTLGFNPVLLTTGYNISPNPVNILSISSLLVNCSIIKDSYLNSSPYQTLYSFFPNVSPGYKVVETPINIVYLPVISRDITSIRIWITDQDGNIVSLNGENIFLRLEIKRL